MNVETGHTRFGARRMAVRPMGESPWDLRSLD